MPNYWYDHVHLTTPDPLKTAEFYEKMFGAKRANVREMPNGRTMVELNLNSSRILVMPSRVKPDPTPHLPDTSYGLEHFGLATDNIEAAVAELKANGVKFRDEIREARPGVKIAFMWAPENVLIELVEKSS